MADSADPVIPPVIPPVTSPVTSADPVTTSVIGVAIETSGRVGSVAVLRDGVVLKSGEFAHGLKHAAGLVPMIDDLLIESGVDKHAVAELYVSVGPGSFTGLRIAVTVVKVWAMLGSVLRPVPSLANSDAPGEPMGVKVVAVPSVRAIVENLPPDAHHAAVVLDAKRGQVFTASYSRNDHGQWLETSGPKLRTLAEILARDPRPLTITGEGLDYHPLPQSTDVTAADRTFWSAQAQVVGQLGHAMARRGEFADVMTLTPTYVRLPEAEEKWRLERGEPI